MTIRSTIALAMLALAAAGCGEKAQTATREEGRLQGLGSGLQPLRGGGLEGRRPGRVGSPDAHPRAGSERVLAQCRRRPCGAGGQGTMTAPGGVTMQSLLRRLLTATALALPLVLQAQTAAPAEPAKAPPANFVAPAEPKPDENNAQRGKTQPGNNAPFWRSVRESGEQPGYSSLPGAEKGMLIQPFVQYPGSRLTQRRRSLAPGAQQLDHSLRRRADPDCARWPAHCSTGAAARWGAICPTPGARSSASRISSGRRTGAWRSRSSCWRCRGW